jgi:hypothetical protein
MKKRIVGLVLFLATISAAFPALAQTPSKTTADLTTITNVAVQSGTTAKALLWVNEEPTQFAQTQMQQIVDFVTKDQPVTNFFPEEIIKEIEVSIQNRTNLSKLTLSEFTSIGIGDYLEQYGDVYGTFQFPTLFDATKIITVLVGYTGADGVVIWQLLETVPLDGKLWVQFPVEVMREIGHDAVLAVLSEPSDAE